ncbi:MAG: AAA family ATPase, partial [Desulfurococcales archaeon]|nr:AAA family ATPase [Desulfurococcales archaeon]
DSRARGGGRPEEKTVCVELEQRERLESRGMEVEGAVDIDIGPSARDCKLMITLMRGQMGLQLRGGECVDESPLLRIGVLTSGILPFNQFDSLIGYFKRVKPEIVDNLVISIDTERFRVDLGTDPWNELVALIRGIGNAEPLIFYSIGRGLQRAFQIALYLEISNILLVDEVESAMHPELLKTVASMIAKAASSRQVVVTTHSLEAASMLASAIVDPGRATGDREALADMLEEACGGSGGALSERIGLVILNREGSTVRSATLRGCDALWHIAGAEDPRLSYRLLRRG